MIKNFGTKSEDKSKIIFFDYFDKLKNKDVLFDGLFEVTKSIPSSSANGFVSIISLKKDKRLKFILKTPKALGGDDTELEFKISREITRQVINDKNIPDCAVKTWASVKCPTDYKDIGKPTEGLKKTACTKNAKIATHIIMEYIIGDTFSAFIEKNGRRDVMNILGIIICCLDALYKKNKFTHYDLHTDNIMIQKGPPRFYNFDINGNKFQFISMYHPVLIDFGRVYIKPFYYNKKRIDLSKEPPAIFEYKRRNYAHIKDMIMGVFIDSNSGELEFHYKLDDILNSFSKITERSNICSYSIREQTLIVAATIIFDFIEHNKDIELSKVSEDRFIDFVFDKYFILKKRVYMDISSTRPNNMTDILKITVSTLDEIDKNPNGRMLRQYILTNYPFLLPGQNFLPLHLIGKKPIAGIFCLDNASDMIQSMIEFKLLPKTIIKKRVLSTRIYKKNILQVDLPTIKNKRNASIIHENIGISRSIVREREVARAPAPDRKSKRKKTKSSIVKKNKKDSGLSDLTKGLKKIGI